MLMGPQVSGKADSTCPVLVPAVFVSGICTGVRPGALLAGAGHWVSHCWPHSQPHQDFTTEITHVPPPLCPCTLQEKGSFCSAKPGALWVQIPSCQLLPAWSPVTFDLCPRLFSSLPWHYAELTGPTATLLPSSGLQGGGDQCTQEQQILSEGPSELL